LVAVVAAAVPLLPCSTSVNLFLYLLGCCKRSKGTTELQEG
jgi:hypothetical protein